MRNDSLFRKLTLQSVTKLNTDAHQGAGTPQKSGEDLLFFYLDAPQCLTRHLPFLQAPPNWAPNHIDTISPILLDDE